MIELYCTLPIPLIASLIDKGRAVKKEIKKILRQVQRSLRLTDTAIQEVRKLVRKNVETAKTEFTEDFAEEKTRENVPDYVIEWDNSLVDRDVTRLNASWVEGETALELMLYSPDVPRRNDGRVTEPTRRRYEHVERGGWYCSGVDLLTGNSSLWGCLKPKHPTEDINGKVIKYEHPLKSPTELFALKVTLREWALIGRRFNVGLPEGSEHVEGNPWLFWQWILEHPEIPVIVAEGCKKSAAVLCCGYVCVALPGVNAGVRIERDEWGDKIPGSRPQLIPQLQILAKGNRRIYIAFDQDKKRSTVRNVNAATETLSKALIAEGCTVNIMAWHPVLGKGIDDVLYNGYQARLLDGMDHESATQEARLSLDLIYRDALEFDDWKTSQLKKLTYPVSLELTQKFLGEVLPPTDQQWICVKSPKNTGKSTWLKWLLLPRLRAGEVRVLGISHRVQLATQLAESLELPIITEASLESSKKGYFLCIDSLHEKSQAQFDYREWSGAVVILDEIQQILWHLLSSSTCQKNRVTIIKTLKKLLNHVVETGGRIIMLDADLNDISIQFINGLLEKPISPWLVENTYKPEPWTIYQFTGTTPASMVRVLLDKVKKGERHMLCVSGQKTKSKWGTRVLEEHFLKECPGLKILRIDSESVADPDHVAFGTTKVLSAVIKNYDLLICSPTIETGVSIEHPDELTPWFKGVWMVGQGVQTCDSVRQNLARYRPPVPRYIWVKEYGINKVGNGATNVKALLAGEFKKDKANIKRLIELGLQETVNDNFESIAILTWAKLATIINSGMGKYAHTILKDLEDEGHLILGADEIPSDDDEDDFLELPEETEIKALKDDITETRDIMYNAELEEIAAANSVTDRDFDRLSTQAQKRKHERLELRKAQLERCYLVPVTPELVKKDDDKWHSEIKLDYYLHEGRKFLSDRDKAIMESALKHGGGDYFSPDTNSKFVGLKISALDWLNFGEIEKLDEIHDNHPLAIQLFEKVKGIAREGVTETQAKSQAYAVELVLGMSTGFRKCSCPMEAIHKIYRMLGKQLPLLRKEGPRGKQLRVFGKAAPAFERDDKKRIVLGEDGKPIPILDGRAEVFAAWVQRDEEAMQKKANEAAAAEQMLVNNYQQLSNDEKDYVELLVEALPECQDQGTFDQLTYTNCPNKTMIVVHAIRRLSKDLQQKVLGFCDQLRSLVNGNFTLATT